MKRRAFRSLLANVVIVAALLSAMLLESPAADAQTGVIKKPCAWIEARISHRIHLGEGFGTSLLIQNCAPDSEWLISTWRINGPCHPHWNSGPYRFRLRRNEGVGQFIDFLSPPCVGLYRFAAKVFHGSHLLGRSIRWMRVLPPR